MSKFINILFWASLVVLIAYVCVLLIAGAAALFAISWKTVLVPIVAILIFMASGYLKVVIDFVKH